MKQPSLSSHNSIIWQLSVYGSNKRSWLFYWSYFYHYMMLAAGVGFEPTGAFTPTQVFKTRLLWPLQYPAMVERPIFIEASNSRWCGSPRYRTSHKGLLKMVTLVILLLSSTQDSAHTTHQRMTRIWKFHFYLTDLNHIIQVWMAEKEGFEPSHGFTRLLP